jgi:sensor histidine kinase YesM
MTEMTYPRYRRIHFLIKKRFQINFIIRFILIIFIAALIYGTVLYTILDKRFEAFFYSPHLKIKSTFDILGPSLLYVNLAVFLCLAIIAFAMIILISRKILGPFNRLKSDVVRVEEGNLWIEESPKSEHLSVMVGENFIQAVKEIRQKIIRMKDSANDLGVITEKLKLLTELKDPEKEKAKEIIIDLEFKKLELKKILSQVKTD